MGHADDQAAWPDDAELEVIVRHIARGCCGTERDWNGHLCRYHLGMLDGSIITRDYLEEVSDDEPDPGPADRWDEEL